jgi:hypothetical protein
MTAWGVATVVGFVAGLAYPWYPVARTITVTGTLVGYVVLLLVVGMWVAACPGCDSFNSYDSLRGIDLMMAFFWGGLMSAVIIGFTYLGSAITLLYGKVGRVHRQ